MVAGVAAGAEMTVATDCEGGGPEIGGVTFATPIGGLVANSRADLRPLVQERSRLLCKRLHGVWWEVGGVQEGRVRKV